MKYLVGAMMITVLSCSAAYAEKKPYYTYGDGKRVLIEKCLEAREKGHAIGVITDDNQGSFKGETIQANKWWSQESFLLGDRLYALLLKSGKGYREFNCTEYKTTLVE